jgi:hypothetical protein
MERAQSLAARIAREAGAGAEVRIRRAYQLALARPPRAAEVENARSFLERQAKVIQNENLRGPDERASASATVAAQAAAWVDFALALLNTNEFLYVP